MKKVLIFADFDKFGGTRTYLKNLIDFYRLYNYQIVTAIEKESCDQDILDFLTKNQIEIVFLSEKYRQGIFLRFHILEIISDLILGIPIIVKERPEIVVISTAFPGKFLGLMVLFPTKLIYILHSYPTCISKINRILLLTSLNAKKRILTVSNFSKNQIINYWLAGKRQKFVYYIHNFSNLENSPHNPINKGNNNVKKVLTLGHVRWYKNPDVWFSVARKTIERYHGDVEFLWAGEGELLDEYRNRIQEENNSKIKLLGFQRNIAELYTQSDIYFQPSLRESHGIAVVDAMIMGIPCVVSSAGGLPESIINEETGYVIEPNDIDAMVEKILQLLEDEDLRKSMGTAGREHYLKNFSHKRWIKEMRVFHEQLG
jgi:glycosyltransferase involved in cell wall biosynthesis